MNFNASPRDHKNRSDLDSVQVFTYWYIQSGGQNHDRGGQFMPDAVAAEASGTIGIVGHLAIVGTLSHCPPPRFRGHWPGKYT